MKIVVLSGAGLSAESGIATFRDQDGLWENHSVDDVATLAGFTEDPALVYSFYNQRRRELQTVEPNAAHIALAKLEKERGADFLHVTQNIDDLCERAGANKVLHMHGELTKCRCLFCAEVVTWTCDADIDSVCPKCGFKSEWGAMRPHVVWFGEMPMRMKEIENALRCCDLFVAIGTSGKVYPAAGFVQIAKEANAKTLLLNKEPPLGENLFDKTIVGNATEIVPEWVGEFIQLI